MDRSGFRPVKDRAGVHVGKERGVVNVQHLNLTRACSTPRGSSMPLDYYPPVCFDRDFGLSPHEFVPLIQRCY